MLVIATSLARFCALGEIVNGFALYSEKKKASHSIGYLWFFFLRNGIEKCAWPQASACNLFASNELTINKRLFIFFNSTLESSMIDAHFGKR